MRVVILKRKSRRCCHRCLKRIEAGEKAVYDFFGIPRMYHADCYNAPSKYAELAVDLVGKSVSLNLLVRK